MLMVKKLNPAEALRKEMSGIVEKRKTLAWGGDQWCMLNTRYNELLALWATARQSNLAEHLKTSGIDDH